jgi:hypothetical protein
MTTLTVPRLEQVYDALAQAIDHAGPQHTELFLTKLNLLLANELGDDARVQQLIDAALKDL